MFLNVSKITRYCNSKTAGKLILFQLHVKLEHTGVVKCCHVRLVQITTSQHFMAAQNVQSVKKELSQTHNIHSAVSDSIYIKFVIYNSPNLNKNDHL